MFTTKKFVLSVVYFVVVLLSVPVIKAVWQYNNCRLVDTVLFKSQIEDLEVGWSSAHYDPEDYRIAEDGHHIGGAPIMDNERPNYWTYITTIWDVEKNNPYPAFTITRYFSSRAGVMCPYDHPDFDVLSRMRMLIIRYIVFCLILNLLVIQLDNRFTINLGQNDYLKADITFTEILTWEEKIERFVYMLPIATIFGSIAAIVHFFFI